MATVRGTVDRPLDEVGTATRRLAVEQGWTLAEGQSGPNTLVFKKGASAWSWGSQLDVKLQASSPSATSLTLSTRESWALTDWGKGKRAAQRLLDALGAHER